jgi:hypothetical protein
MHHREVGSGDLFGCWADAFRALQFSERGGAALRKIRALGAKKIGSWLACS